MKHDLPFRSGINPIGAIWRAWAEAGDNSVSKDFGSRTEAEQWLEEATAEHRDSSEAQSRVEREPSDPETKILDWPTKRIIVHRAISRVGVVILAALAAVGIWQDLALHHEVNGLEVSSRNSAGTLTASHSQSRLVNNASGRIGRLESKLSALEGQLSGLEGQQSTVQGQLSTVNRQINTMAGTVGGLLASQNQTTSNVECLDNAVANPNSYGTSCG